MTKINGSIVESTIKIALTSQEFLHRKRPTQLLVEEETEHYFAGY